MGATGNCEGTSCLLWLIPEDEDETAIVFAHSLRRPFAQDKVWDLGLPQWMLKGQDQEVKVRTKLEHT
jgi:hypothetical protein